jgi:ParB family chromosome partitioning protein
MSNQKNRGLGKGFDSLIPTTIIDEQYDPTISTVGKQTVEPVLVRDIEPNPHQPRKEFKQDALNALALSIDMHGLLQPIVVMKYGDKYRLIAGERRLRAFKHLGEETIPALVRSAEEQAQMELALIENLQREDLNILEVATALYKLADQFNLDNQEVGKRVGRSSSSVHNIIRLLGLPDDAKKSLAEGAISEGHARQIMALDGQAAKQSQLLEYILKYNWSVRQAENFVKKFKESGATTEDAIRRVQATNPITEKLAQKLKAKVHMRHMAKTNQLIIEYKNDDEFDRITSQLL